MRGSLSWIGKYGEGYRVSSKLVDQMIWILDVELVVTSEDGKNDGVVDEIREQEHDGNDEDERGDDGWFGIDRYEQEHRGAGVSVVNPVASGELGKETGVGRGGHLEPEAQDNRGELEEYRGDDARVDWVVENPVHTGLLEIVVQCSSRSVIWSKKGTALRCFHKEGCKVGDNLLSR